MRLPSKNAIHSSGVFLSLNNKTFFFMAKLIYAGWLKPIFSHHFCDQPAISITYDFAIWTTKTKRQLVFRPNRPMGCFSTFSAARMIGFLQQGNRCISETDLRSKSRPSASGAERLASVIKVPIESCPRPTPEYNDSPAAVCAEPLISPRRNSVNNLRLPTRLCIYR